MATTEFKSKSKNPAFVFADYGDSIADANEGVTSVGVMAWSFLYIAIMCCTGGWAWTQTYSYAAVEGTFITDLPPQVWTIAIGGMLGGFVVALFTIFNPRLSPYTAPVYSALEGLILGTISAAFETAYPGIIVNTVLSTLGVFVTVAFLYGSGIVKVNETFKMVLLSVMCAILIVYFADIILRLFAVYSFPFLHEQGSWWAIAFSIGVIIVAGLNFAWDFENVKEAQEQKAPKYFECYLAFGFMLTLVWLYLEVLRLWALTQGKKD